ncbi:hypothetical protein PMIN03_012537 [Paraphaeosphaeria minitans]
MGPSDLDNSPLPFLHLISELKRIPRTGWLRTVQNPESVSAHMYQLAVMCMFAPENLNRNRCIFIALCHDMAESVVGDIPTYAGVSKEHKHKLERFGVDYIETLLSLSNSEVGARIKDAWLEYEEGKTPEAQFVREMDKLECLMQAHRYEQQTFGEKDLQEFQGLSAKITSHLGTAWMELLNQEREAHYTKRRERTPVIFIIGVGKDTQCALLSKQLEFQTTTLDEALREKADDPTHPCAKYIQHCIQEKVQVPVQLAISILERKINEGLQKGKKWTLLRGFPESIQHLTEFQEQVQKFNYTLLLTSNRVGSVPNTQTIQEMDAMKCLAIDGYFKEVNDDGSAEEVYERIESAVEGFVKHAQRVNSL